VVCGVDDRPKTDWLAAERESEKLPSGASWEHI